jgi:hypothetical protein
MAVGDYTNFEIYEDEFYGAMNETLVQNTEVFNAASQNALVLEPDPQVGNFRREAFYESIGSGLIDRRNKGSTSSQTPDSLSSDDMTSPQLARKYYVSNTLDSLRDIGADPGEFSLAIGEQVAKGMQVDYLDTQILALVTALNQLSTPVNNQGGSSSISTKLLANTLRIFGDASNQIVAWVMHSEAFFDLMTEQIDNKIIDRVAGATIYEGTVGTLGLPAIVTDSSELKNTTPTPNQFRTLGLTPNAAAALQDGQPTESDGINRGNENLEFEIQGEHDFTLELKGYDWDSATVNPDDSALSTGGNWQSVMDSVKDTAGVMLVSDKK